MPFIQAGDNFKPLSFGNINGIPDAWVGNGIRDFDGAERKFTFALGKLTDTLQTAIPLIIPSWRKDQTSFPDRPLVLPAGVLINYVALRLPEYGTMFEGVTAPYGLLDQNTTIIGTTGENLKVSPNTGTTHTTTAPALTCANNVYTPDSFASVFRRSSLPDQASPSWLTAPPGSAITPQITVSNAGNTAAGNGIRLSKTGAVAFIIVWFALEFDAAPPRLREVELPIPPS